MYRRFFILSLVLLSLYSNCTGQDYFRLQADISVKISNSDGTKSLTRGIVFYDKNIQDLIYDLAFPRKEIWVSKDTSLYKYNQDSLIQRVTIPSINEFTIFHLALNADLNDYGLKKSNYNMTKVEKKGDLVLSYWRIPDQLELPISLAVIARKENRLESVILLGKDQEILSKQFFRNYITIDAFEFPGQIVQILYDSLGGENYQVTDFSNIVINDLSHPQFYEFKL